MERFEGERVKVGLPAEARDQRCRSTFARFASYGGQPSPDSVKVGAEDWNRTSDTSIFSAVLYQLSYLGPAKPALAEQQ